MARRLLPTAGSPATLSFRDALRHGANTLVLVWRTNRWLVVGITALTLAVALLPALATFLGKLVVDGVVTAIATGTPAARDAAMIWVAAEALALAILLAFRRLLPFQKNLLKAELSHAVSCQIIDKALRMDLGQIEDPEIQHKIVLARQDAASGPYNFVNRLFEVLQYGLSLVTFAALLWVFSPWAVVIVLVGGLPLFLSEVHFSDKLFRIYTGRTPEMRERTYLETLMTSDTAAPERLHADAGPQIMDRYRALFDLFYGEDRRLQARRTYLGILLGAIGSLIFFGGTVWIVWVAIGGTITLGQMVMFIGLLKQGQPTTASLLGTLGGGYEDLLYISNFYGLLAVPDAPGGGSADAGPLPGDGLRLEGVSFAYPGAAGNAVEDVTLHLPPGTRLGIIGVNGSGKTTLVRLMMGLYRPSAGTVRLDGLDLAEWHPQTLNARFAALFQPFQNYKMTVGDNIAMGEGLRVDDEDLLTEAAERGLAGSLVHDLAEGLRTRLTRRFTDGRELSRGQWQRLALSRAMLRQRADILILDEPTSAMDPVAEAAFIDFTPELHGKTVVLISHRLANLRTADRVIVLDKGHIVEDGDHRALMKAQGIYYALFRKQARDYADDGLYESA